jgi:hypothetical protein
MRNPLNSIVIMPTEGLCNRLRVIFSYFKLVQQHGGKLFVIWDKTKRGATTCPGHFLDYFEPIDNITFVSNEQKFKIDYTGYNAKPCYSPDYRELKLQPFMMETIKRKMQILDKYIAVHIRRTDHEGLAKKYNSYTTDSEFIRFIEKNKIDKKLYVATDNKTTYDFFKNKFNDLIKFPSHNETEGLRRTSLEDSIIDLYMCIYASDFMGSGLSSFSEVIKCIRRQMVWSSITRTPDVEK